MSKRYIPVSRLVGIVSGLGALASGLAVVAGSLGPKWVAMTTACGLIATFCERATGGLSKPRKREKITARVRRREAARL
jgi:hypothetical protein